VEQWWGGSAGLEFVVVVFPDDDESDEESVKKTNKCSLVWEVSGSSGLVRVLGA